MIFTFLNPQKSKMNENYTETPLNFVHWNAYN